MGNKKFVFKLIDSDEDVRTYAAPNEEELMSWKDALETAVDDYKEKNMD